MSNQGSADSEKPELYQVFRGSYDLFNVFIFTLKHARETANKYRYSIVFLKTLKSLGFKDNHKFTSGNVKYITYLFGPIIEQEQWMVRMCRISDTTCVMGMLSEKEAEGKFIVSKGRWMVSVPDCDERYPSFRLTFGDGNQTRHVLFRIAFSADGENAIFVFNQDCEGYSSFEELVKAASTPRLACEMGQETAVESSDNNNNNNNTLLLELQDFLSRSDGTLLNALNELNDVYHGEMCPDDAEGLVRSRRVHGAFLIRRSSRNPQCFTITSRGNDAVIFHTNFRAICMGGQLHFVYKSVFYPTWGETLTAMQYDCDAELDIPILGPYHKPPPRRELKWPEGWPGTPRSADDSAGKSAGKSADDSADKSMQDD
jgi:hypothetical protein